MLARARAAVAVIMLAGIFVLAGLVIAVLLAAVVWCMTTGSPLGVVAGFAFGSVTFVLVVGLVRVVRATPHLPDGLAVSVMAEPALWEMARTAAASVGTRTPDEIRLVVDANASVSEDSRFLGLVPGIRVLSVGVPFLQTMTRAELMFVIGHELGHLSERHVALTGVTRRGLLALRDISEAWGPRHPLRWVFRGYLSLYARVVHALWRRQELDADLWAAGLTGSAVGVAALRDVAVTAHTWGAFAHDYASIGTRVGMVPRPLFAGYADFLSDPVRGDVDAGELIAAEQTSPFDTHPPTSRRLERLAAMAAEDGSVPHAASDDDPALLVLIDPARTIVEVEAHLARTRALAPASWERAVLFGARRRDDERAVHAMTAVDALTPGVPDLSVAFHLVAHGGSRRLAELLAGRALDDETVALVVRKAFGSLVRSALVGAGHASYVLRWDRADVILDEAGVEVDVDELVAGVPDNPAQADWLLEVLRDEGISRTWHPAISSGVLGPSGPDVHAVLVGRQTWGWSTPVLYVTDAGMGLRRVGYREYHSIGPISPRKSPDQLLAHSMRLDGLFLLGDPGTEIVPWDQVEQVTYVDGAVPRLTVRRHGRSTSYRAVGVAGDVLQAFARFVYGRVSLG